jgi:hypothetical protein
MGGLSYIEGGGVRSSRILLRVYGTSVTQVGVPRGVGVDQALLGQKVIESITNQTA